MKPIATPSRTQEILNQYQLSAKKKFGQNFLIDPLVIERICDKAQLDQETLVIEVGPGIGALSEKLCERSGQVVAFEIDEDMVNVLHDVLKDKDNFKVVHQDFLKADLAEVIKAYPYVKIKVVANLPYYITAKLLEKIALLDIGISEVIVMVQKDVAIKMAVSEDLRDRLPLTLFLKSLGEVKLLFDVPRGVFMPSPNVDSAILSIRFNEEKRPLKQGFYQFLKVAFTARRKTLLNNLKSVTFDEPLKELLEKRDLALDIRAEALSIKNLKYLFEHTTSL